LTAPIVAIALGFAIQTDAALFDPGLPVGARSPDFEATDQDGRTRHFEDLRGPEGLALLFFRSADW
jgi:hypothetical protein